MGYITKTKVRADLIIYFDAHGEAVYWQRGTTKAELSFKAGKSEDVPPVLSMNEISKAVADYRNILLMNGHKPHPFDSKRAVAQAQRDADVAFYQTKREVSDER